MDLSGNPVRRDQEIRQGMSAPGAVEARLNEIDAQLERLANSFEAAAMAWFRVKRDREKQWATAYIQTDGTAGLRKAQADLEVADVGIEEEGLFEAKKAVSRMLDTRAAIGMSILRAQSRMG